MKILVCISGASGAFLGIDLLEALENLTIKPEIYAIISDGAKIVLEKEHNINFNEILNKFINIKFLDNQNLSECVSSGSFGITHTIVAPCSINTLAKINAGISDTLITRACAVAIKERHKLVLGVREMPFSSINLSHMLNLSNLGAVIAPPIFGFYAGNSDKQMRDFIIGKWLDCLNIKHSLYKRWN